MFHKGAIKKVSGTKDVPQSTIKSKSKSSSSSKESESSEKLESRRIRASQSNEQKGEGDGHPKISQSSKTTSKQSVRSSQSKSGREPSSSVSRLNINNSKASVRNSSSSKTSDNSIRKSSSSSSNATKSGKSTEKIRSSYLEKRGTSTIYVPQSMTSRLNAKLTSKSTSQVPKHEVKSNSTTETTESKTKSRQRKLSRTLSPSEVKMLHSATKRSDHPQRVDQSKESHPETKQMDSEYNYEDDFEDYESDFQECSDSETSEVSEATNSDHSNLPVDPIELQTMKQRKIVNSAEHKEEEHMHDSGHYELTEARKRAARIESIANDPKISSLLELKQPVNKTYSEDRSLENKSLPSSTDEGFEDSRSGDFTKSSTLSHTSFIEFRKTKENYKMKKSKKNLSRGEELLEMIKLDVMEWSLLECSPIPYEEFIRSYGKLNTQQISTQTGEDNIDVETQTEKIVFGNKWTQFPITCRTNLQTKEDLYLFKMDQAGVGDDNDIKVMNSASSSSFDVLRLCDFVNRAGRVVLSLLEERQSGGNVFKNEQQVSFSDGVVKLCIGSITFLSGRPVTIIHYSEVSNKILMTIHSAVEEEIETSNKQDYITDCCIGCVWNISEPSMPIKLFYSACPITACCFHLTNYNVVFAGLQDGSISLWDLKEDEMWHHKVVDKANERNWTIRMPTYTTTNAEINIHNSEIVAIRILSKIEEKSFEQRNNKFVPIQICSLNENGSLIIWSVLHSMGINVDDLGLSFWGSVRLVKSQEVLLQFDNRTKIGAAAFIDMHVDCVDSNNLYIATNSSNILHATCIGNKANPAVYKNFDTNPCGNVTCIETCPFGHSFFLVGCDDGTIRLHSLNFEKPILQLKDENSKYEIKSIQWSKSKPFTIFVLDNNSCVHMWDLSNSDIHPTYTVNMRNSGCISSMQLSSCKTKRDMSHQYLAFGTETGNVEIHKLRANVHYTKKEDYLEELNTFLRYVAIL